MARNFSCSVLKMRRILTGLCLLAVASLLVILCKFHQSTPTPTRSQRPPLRSSPPIALAPPPPPPPPRSFSPSRRSLDLKAWKNGPNTSLTAPGLIPIKQKATANPSDIPAEAGPQKLLCLTFKGRFGNHLFQFASVLGLAHRLHRTAVFSASRFLNQALQLPPLQPSAEQRKRCHAARVARERVCCQFHNDLLKLDPHRDYQVSRYLQSWKYFEGAEAEVRKALLFKDSVQKRVKGKVEELKRLSNHTLVGIHIRRGDYLRPGSIRGGYRSPPPDYYLRAMDFMRRRFGKVTFLVAVDNTTWFLESVTLSSDVIMLKRDTPVVDMALLASLDHVIISVGSFSWWVGFLNKGETVYWKDFIAPGTFIGKSYGDGATYVYPEWIPL
ncbi:galactoside alpha-(1,2)-fucosyltransferase 1-like [Babylonia areolata]|uniref:galactoside alpha-(1,2)-fucosyltransferase 1-like n=1 Tax=Babylonia areolata TaxID=304850 RepID=UPI003FD359F9